MKLELCRYMRWKGYAPDMSELEIIGTFQANRVPYTCLLTCHNFGPDSDVCAPEACTTERSCYQESPLVKTLVARG